MNSDWTRRGWDDEDGDVWGTVKEEEKDEVVAKNEEKNVK